MIDRVNRNRLAQALRQLISGAMTNLEFDELDFDGTTDSKDPAIYEIFRTAWFLYDDFHVHPILVTEGTRLDMARAAAFLYTDLEYEWPAPNLIVNLLKRILFFRNRDKINSVDQRYWPFFRKEDYEEAMLKPHLLTGTRA